MVARIPGRNGNRPSKRKGGHFGLIQDILSGKAPAKGREIAAAISGNAKLAELSQLRAKERSGKISPAEQRQLRFLLLDIRYGNLDPKIPKQMAESWLLFDVLRLKVLRSFQARKELDAREAAELARLSRSVSENQNLYTSKYGLTDADIEQLTNPKK